MFRGCLCPRSPLRPLDSPDDASSWAIYACTPDTPTHALPEHPHHTLTQVRRRRHCSVAEVPRQPASLTLQFPGAMIRRTVPSTSTLLLVVLLLLNILSVVVKASPSKVKFVSLLANDAVLDRYAAAVAATEPLREDRDKVLRGEGGREEGEGTVGNGVSFYSG